MSDIGDLEILEYPLIIRQAKVGGRKLTRTLWNQMPMFNNILLIQENVRIRGWINLHQKNCGDEFVNHGEDVLREHKHLLIQQGDNPMRCIIFRPAPRMRVMTLDTEAEHAARVLVARNCVARYEKSDHKYNEFIQMPSIATHNDFSINLNWEHSSEPISRLREMSEFGLEQSTLFAAIDDDIGSIIEFRDSLASQWQFVENEVPQIFL